MIPVKFVLPLGHESCLMVVQIWCWRAFLPKPEKTVHSISESPSSKKTSDKINSYREKTSYRDPPKERSKERLKRSPYPSLQRHALKVLCIQHILHWLQGWMKFGAHLQLLWVFWVQCFHWNWLLLRSGHQHSSQIDRDTDSVGCHLHFF